MTAETFTFGMLSTGEAVTAARLTGPRGMSVTVLDYGAIIQSLVVPDRNGNPVDVVLGYDTAAEYEADDAHLGGTIGRVANRIGGAAFTLGGTTYRLAANDGENHLHGGLRGFDRRMWDLCSDGISIICSRLSPDGEEGYPGNFLTPRPGKGGRPMDRRGAICLETQVYPNGLAISDFPSPILRAGRHLHSETVYSFATFPTRANSPTSHQ